MYCKNINLVIISDLYDNQLKKITNKNGRLKEQNEY